MNEKTETTLTNAQAYKLVSRRWEINDHRFASAQKRRATLTGAIRYDEPFVGDDGEDMREDRSLSDCGKGADYVRTLGMKPAWLSEMERVLDTLDEDERRVVDALFVDLRPAKAARIAGVSRSRVYRVMAALRDKLAPAYALLNETCEHI